jgi:hypothetical protein
MLGIEDPVILLGYILSIGVTVICIIYGYWKKDKGDD